MKKLKNIFEEVLFDKVILEENKESSIKLFFKSDIRITRGGSEDEAEGTSYVNKSSGEVVVPEERVENIQNLHNIVDYSASLIKNGKNLINDIVSEIIKTAADAGSESLQDLVQEEDRIIVDIDYGFEERDSVGVKINKTSGSDLVSFSMKKNGNIIPGTFDMSLFEQQVLAIRERYMDKE